jgi:hypothetical protein
MADIAAVFHWPPDVMGQFALEELMQWHRRAQERYKQKMQLIAQLLGATIK